MVSRKTYLEMIRAYPGGAEVMAAALGMSESALSNRIYERKNQTLTVNQVMQMQAFSGTTLFAEAVAAASGGVFFSLPEVEDVGNDELLGEFNKLYAELGELSADFRASIANGEIDAGERAKLDGDGREIHRTVSELLALIYQVYCKQA